MVNQLGETPEGHTPESIVISVYHWFQEGKQRSESTAELGTIVPAEYWKQFPELEYQCLIFLGLDSAVVWVLFLEALLATEFQLLELRYDTLCEECHVSSL